MRVWDLCPTILCRQHLLGEHREIHAIWSIIHNNKKGGYQNHPEVKRWVGKLNALRKRHDQVVNEMLNRGYNHHSPIIKVNDCESQNDLINTIDEQLEWIRSKECDCRL